MNNFKRFLEDSDIEWNGAFLFNMSVVLHEHNGPNWKRRARARFNVRYIRDFMDSNHDPEMETVFHEAKAALGAEKRHWHPEVEHVRHTTYRETTHENGSLHYACLCLDREQDYLNHEIVYLRLEDGPLVIHRVFIQEHDWTFERFPDRILSNCTPRPARELFYLEQF